MMDQEEWITRCAAQYMKRGGLTQDQANEAAEALLFELGDYTKYGYSPEDDANGDMDCWTDDGGE